MSATTIDNTLPGARPERMTSPFVVWIAAFLAGPVFGSIWLYRNANYLGCRDTITQGKILIATALFCAPMLVLIDIIKDSFERGSLERLGNQVLMNLVILIAVIVGGYCYNRQTRMFRLHALEIQSAPKRLGRAVLFVLAAWIATSALLAIAPPLGEAMGGIAYFLS
ncbi:MAG: hypothetical protein AAFR73_00325 [Pseudomonadota bacterium]